MNKTKPYKQEAVQRLRDWLPVGTTIEGIVVNVAPSGMSRSIRFLYVNEGRITEIPPGWIAAAIGERLDEKRSAVRVSGCGMDMVFASIYALALALYGDSQALRYGRNI